MLAELCAQLCTFANYLEVFLSTFSDRLREERKRLGLNQTEMATLAGVQKRAQVNYEAGERFPDAAYLMAIAGAGANVLYILTGEREGAAPEVLTAEERVMLNYFRQASPPVRKAALGALLSAAPATRLGGTHSQHASGDGSIQIGSMGSNPTKRRG